MEDLLSEKVESLLDGVDGVVLCSISEETFSRWARGKYSVMYFMMAGWHRLRASSEATRRRLLVTWVGGDTAFVWSHLAFRALESRKFTSLTNGWVMSEL